MPYINVYIFFRQTSSDQKTSSPIRATGGDGIYNLAEDPNSVQDVTKPERGIWLRIKQLLKIKK